MSLEEDFIKAVQEGIKVAEERRKKIEKRIIYHITEDGDTAEVKIKHDHAGEHWYCGYCGSPLRQEIILDGVKRPNFCSECGVLLEWSENE